jgi:ribosomal protein S18 acetylase RimI-like enzyme
MINDLSAPTIAPNVEVRKYESEDLQSILHEMNGKSPRRRRDKFKLVECSDAFFCYVAEEDTKIKGFVIVEDLGDSISYYLVQINVAEKRKGIGRELIQKVFQTVGEGGHISLCINMDNEDSIKFFEAMGFRRSGHTEGYRKNQDKYWYQIDL